MAFSFDVNGANQAANLQWFRFKTALVAAGWTVEKSGTGTAGTGSGAYSASADILTTGALMGNTRPWFVIKKPGGESRFCIQLDSTGASARIKYAVAPFTGGSPAAGVVPSASGEVILYGGNTDASPTISSISDGTNRANIIVGDATENYCFLFMTHGNGVSGLRTGFLFDAMRAGTYPTEDTDPHIVHISAVSTGVMNSTALASLSAGLAGFFLSADGTRRWTWFSMVTWYAQGAAATAIPGAMGADPMTGNDLLFPAIVARYGASGAGASGNSSPAYKGVSRMIHWAGTNRAFGDTISSGGTKNYLVIGGTTTPAACNVVVPWNGSDLTI